MKNVEKFNKAELVNKINTDMTTTLPSLEVIKKLYEDVEINSEIIKFDNFNDRFLTKAAYHKIIKRYVREFLPSNEELGNTKIKDRMIAVEIVANQMTTAVFNAAGMYLDAHGEVIPSEIISQSFLIQLKLGSLDHLLNLNESEKDDYIKLAEHYAQGYDQ